MDEVWKRIENFPDYEVSNHGRIRSNRFGKTRIMKQNNNGFNYFQVEFKINGIRNLMRVHRLVLEAFSGKCPDGMECSHLDGNGLNNHVENLIWESRADNNRRRTCVKLNASKVSQIKKLLNDGLTLEEIAKKFGVHFSTIGYIKLNKTWKEGTL